MIMNTIAMVGVLSGGMLPSVVSHQLPDFKSLPCQTAKIALAAGNIP